MSDDAKRELENTLISCGLQREIDKVFRGTKEVADFMGGDSSYLSTLYAEMFMDWLNEAAIPDTAINAILEYIDFLVQQEEDSGH